MAHYESKKGKVRRSPFELYMSFCDMRNFVQMLPEDKKASVTADFDSITGTVQGMTIGVKITGRHPYSQIDIEDNGSPLHFSAVLHFDATPSDGNCTEFSIECDVELNFMMKMAVGNKLKEALDKVVDAMAENGNINFN